MQKPTNEVQDSLVVRAAQKRNKDFENKPNKPSEGNEDATLSRAHQEENPEDKLKEFFELDECIPLRGGQEEVAHLRRELARLKERQEFAGRPVLIEAKAATSSQIAPPAGPTMPSITPSEFFTLGEFFATITDARRLIGRVILSFLLLGLGYVVISNPTYQVNALLDIQKTAPSIGALSDISVALKNGLAQESALTEEIETLRSRHVLGEVVDDLALDIVAQPIYFPLVGATIAQINTLIKSGFLPSYSPDIPLVDMDNYAWSNEHITIGTLAVPTEHLGEKFTLVAKGNDQYQLFDQEGHLLTEGKVGVPNYKWLPIDKPHELLVSRLDAHPGIRFELTKIPRIQAIDQLTQALIIKEKLPEGYKAGDTSMVQLTLQGTDRNKIIKTVNTIVDTFVKQDIAKKSDEVKNSIEFTEEQKRTLKQQMETAEEALNNYRQKRGAVDLSKESEILLQRMVAMETQLSELKRNRAELLQKFTPQHPNITALDTHIAALNKQMEALDEKVKTFPSTQQELLRLSRDTELYTQLYTFLSNRIEQLKVMGAGPFGAVRVVDRPELPYVPVSLKKEVVIVLSLLLGLLFGIGAAFLRKALRSAVQDPDTIEKQLGLPVYATVPHSIKQSRLRGGPQYAEQDIQVPDLTPLMRLSRALRLFLRPSVAHREVMKDGEETKQAILAVADSEVMKDGEETKQAILAVADSTDPTIESLRSLRTSFHFVLLEAKNNVILITGPTPGVGKSFLTVNFGTVLASTGKRVLLIDGDLRRGQINKYFGIESREEGLSDVIANEKNIATVIRNTNINGLDIICTGTMPPNPSELLSHERLESAIQRLSARYDYVLIDSPPVLVVTDAAILGRLAGAALLVVKAGEHTLREIEHSVKRLKQGGVNLRGVIFNDMPVSKTRYGYGNYYGYAHAYSYEK